MDRSTIRYAVLVDDLDPRGGRCARHSRRLYKHFVGLRLVHRFNRMFGKGRAWLSPLRVRVSD